MAASVIHLGRFAIWESGLRWNSCREVFSTLPDTYDEISLVVIYFRKNFHHRCLIGSLRHLWLISNKRMKKFVDVEISFE